jgi:pentatricopeptide repeat protein
MIHISSEASSSAAAAGMTEEAYELFRAMEVRRLIHCICY